MLSPGVCAGIGTANTMHLACEALGMALPGSTPVRANSEPMWRAVDAAAALLVLGFLTAVGCKNMTVAAAERERDAAERAMRDRVYGVTRDLVLEAAGREIAEYERFRQELAVASAVLSRSTRLPRIRRWPNGRCEGHRPFEISC